MRCSHVSSHLFSEALQYAHSSSHTTLCQIKIWKYQSKWLNESLLTDIMWVLHLVTELEVCFLYMCTRSPRNVIALRTDLPRFISSRSPFVLGDSQQHQWSLCVPQKSCGSQMWRTRAPSHHFAAWHHFISSSADSEHSPTSSASYAPFRVFRLCLILCSCHGHPLFASRLSLLSPTPPCLITVTSSCIYLMTAALCSWLAHTPSSHSIGYLHTSFSNSALEKEALETFLKTQGSSVTDLSITGSWSTGNTTI